MAQEKKNIEPFATEHDDVVKDLTLLSKLIVEKPQYLHKEAIKILDEEFEEFTPKIKNGQMFFGMYNSMFYDLPRDIHRYFLQFSQKHAGDYVDNTLAEINRLKKEQVLIQKQIDSVEQHHPFFKNGQILCPIDNKDGSHGIGAIWGPKWYMHSGKARYIYDDYNHNYKKIKKKLGYYPNTGPISDMKILIGVSPSTIAGIPKGPDCGSIDKLFIPTYEVNIYKG